MERIRQQAAFAMEADREKEVYRQNYLADASRRENDAEHAWHAALMALIFAEYSQESVDILKVVKMLLIHDLVEIDAGDSYAYDAAAQATAHEREQQAADRIFALLPEDQEQEYRDLWEEFEAYDSPEANYAHVMDNFQPFLLNDASCGVSWREHQVRKGNILQRNARTPEIAPQIWAYMESLIDCNIQKGNIREEL